MGCGALVPLGILEFLCSTLFLNNTLAGKIVAIYEMQHNKNEDILRGTNPIKKLVTIKWNEHSSKEL